MSPKKGAKGEFLPTHGGAGHATGPRPPTYVSWIAMKSRCNYRKHPAYSNYGGRGISVCARWSESFEAFLSDMGERPAGTSLDRIDNAKGYEPGNCRWATPKEQRRNSSGLRMLTFGGRTMPLIDWAKEVGMKHSALRMRLDSGWSVEKTLTTPLLSRRPVLSGTPDGRNHGRAE